VLLNPANANRLQRPPAHVTTTALPAALRLKRTDRVRASRAWTGLLWPAIALAAAGAVALPLVAVAVAAARPLSPVWHHLAETVLPAFVVNSLALAVGVGLLAGLVGVGTAWLVAMYRFPGRGVLEVALLLPLSMPAYILAYVYADALDVAGPVQGWIRASFGLRYGDYWFPEVRTLPGAILMLALALYPYVYLLCRAAFMEQSACQFESARLFGTRPGALFWRVGLPMARPALAAGIGLAVMEALADFATVEHFAVRTFTTGIYDAWFHHGDRFAASQLAVCLMGVVALALGAERFLRGGRRYHHSSVRCHAPEETKLSGLSGWLAAAACAAPVLFGFLAPAAILAAHALTRGDPLFGRHFLPYAWNSLWLAGAAALLCVTVATAIAYGGRLVPSPAVRNAGRVAALGYAVPGSVIAVGVLVPLGAFDNALDGWMRSHLGLATGLLLSGSFAALLYAYVVRFLAVALSTVEAGLSRIEPALEDAGRLGGGGPRTVLARISLPLMRRSLLAASVLVFVDTMKELPATLIVRPFDLDTLAVRVHNLASDERLAEASTAALAIVLAGLLPIAWLTRMMQRDRGSH
jgi:iron(III) transport system permease protein